jgi:hypothetical protein
MGKLAELVKQDYDEEVKIIREAGGNLWLQGLGMAFCFVVLRVFDLFLGDPWSNRETAFAIIAIVAYPFIHRGWQRHEVAAKMRHEREVRVEAKVDALLGLVNIKDAEDEG